MTARLIIYAPGIHSGGGQRLQEALYEALPGRDHLLICDSRTPELPDTINAIRYRNNFIGRLQSELFLLRANRDDIILCMATLPPLLPIKCHTVIYFQNALVFSARDPRSTLQRALFRIFIRKDHTVFCQTTGIKALLKTIFGVDAVCAPFLKSTVDAPIRVTRNRLRSERVAFLYPSSGATHKNHITLVRAWIKLVERTKVVPELRLTISPGHRSLRNVDLVSCNIRPLGWLTLEELQEEYSHADAVIFPSLSETMALPLLEAHRHGRPVLCSARPFANQFIEPYAQFDPLDPESIVCSVSNFLIEARKVKDPRPSDNDQTVRLLDGEEFLDLVVEETCRRLKESRCDDDSSRT